MRRFAALSAALCWLGAALPAWAAEPLRVGLLSGESAPDVIRRHDTFRAAFEKALGRPVHLVVGVDYSTTVEALRFGRLDIAFLGPASYVLLRSRSDAEPLVRPVQDGKSSFQAAIIVRVDGPVQDLADLRGREVAFGDVASTGGHVVPRFMLQRSGLKAGADYQLRHLGAHDAVALAVANGRVAAGGISLPALKQLIAQGTISASAIRIIGTSDDIPEYAWVASPRLDRTQKAALRRAFNELQDLAALRPFRAERFGPAEDRDYAPVADMMRALGLVPAGGRS